MSNLPRLTSSELATLWMTYQQKTMALRMLEHFIKHGSDENSREILQELYQEVIPYQGKIVAIFEEEGAAVPVGFTEEDVNLDAPKLYDHGFDIMFIRMLKAISTGMHALHLTMTYRTDIALIYKELTGITETFSIKCTEYLLERGLLTRPPYVSMPDRVEFARENSYLGGMNPFGKKRTVNTVEVAHLHYAIESNMAGIMMLTGFAQVAQDQEVKEYFLKGIEIAKGIINGFTETLMEDGVQVPIASGGNVTRSTVLTFSDKLMMYCTSLFCSFSLGKNALGTAFSLRSDIPAKVGLFSSEIFEYARQGAKLMIKHGWLEEPPQMEERNKLV